MKFRTISRLYYFKRARHRRGHGIHSPFLFRLITSVIEGKRNNPDYKVFKPLKKEAIRILRGRMVPELEKLFVQHHLSVSKPRKLYRKIVLPQHYLMAIFRLLRFFQPSNIFMYGPDFGVTSSVFCLASSKSTIYHIEEDPIFQRFSEELNSKWNILTYNYIREENHPSAKAEFALINYPFDPVLSKKIFQNRIDEHGPDDVVVIRGIHESKEMEAVWLELKSSTEVRVSLDLFEIGIVLFRKGLQKEDFILKF
jgi:hypothetical protein